MYLSASSTTHLQAFNLVLLDLPPDLFALIGVVPRSAPSLSAVSLYFDYAGPDRVPVGNDVVNGGFCRSSDLHSPLRQ